MNRIAEIKPSDKAAYMRAKARWDSIAKPLGSFGRLEEQVCGIAAVSGSEDIDISNRAVVVMCADHGVVAEGVTQCGSEVTAECAAAIADGRSSVNALAGELGARVIAVDVGIASDVECEKLLDRKVAYGTRNIAREAAMTADETERAIVTGMDIVGQLGKEGVRLIVAGEMGIGNTTCAGAMAAALLGLPAEEVTGRGAGLSSEGLERKISAVKRAIEVNKPDADDPFGLLQRIGGLEIAAMTGLFLGGAYYRIPVVIDGVTSAAAAAVAFKLAPLSADHMLASHCSGEPAAAGLLRLIGQKPVIDAGLRLGEGTGGMLLLPLLDGAIALYRNARRFEETTIERYVELK